MEAIAVIGTDDGIVKFIRASDLVIGQLIA
jgi:hypothetical protein